MILLRILHNLAVLIAIAVFYDLLGTRFRTDSRKRQLIAGLLFGLATLLAMSRSVELAPGVFYDGRVAIIAAAGSFTGAPAALPAAAAALVCRLVLGGFGTIGGVVQILIALGVGVGFYYLRRNRRGWHGAGAFLGVGFLLGVIDVILQLIVAPAALSPADFGLFLIATLGAYPTALLLTGQVFTVRESHRAAEDRRRTANELYRGLFEDTYAVMLVVRPDDGVIVDASPAATDFYGWSHEELTSMRITEINTLSEEEIREEMENARRRRREYFEFRHRRADGSVRDVVVRSGLVTAAGEEYLHSIVFDVTEQKKVERERDLMLFGMDHAAVGVLRVNDDGLVEAANLKACELLGYRRSELLGTPIFDIDRDLTEAAWQEGREASRAQGTRRFESYHLRKDGTEYPVEVTVARVSFENEEYFFSFFLDMSEQREYRERLQRVIREKDALLQEIHHRVKNNLAVIASLINLQVNGAENWEQAFGALLKTRDRINTMGEVHNTLYQSGDLSRLDFSEFVRQRIVSLRYTYPREVDLSLSCPQIEIDIERAVPLSIVFNELVTNALKHAFPEDWTGSLTVEVIKEGDETVTLTVEDNGSGLPWEPGEEPASAMGVHLSRLLTEQLNGELRLHSEAGTTAVVRVPLEGRKSRLPV